MEKYIVSNTIQYSDGSETIVTYPANANQTTIAESIASDIEAAQNPVPTEEKVKKTRKTK